MTHRRLLSLAALAALALVLASCQVTVTDGRTPTFPPSLAGTVEAQDTSNPDAQASGSLAPGTVRYYRVNVPTARGLLYGEVTDNSGLRVSLHSSSGSLLSVSNSRTFFAASLAGLSAAEADVDVGGSSIAVPYVCFGPCAAVVPSVSTYYLAVANTSGSSRSYEVFAYTMDETDENEPNDASLSATLLSGVGSDVGAIEVVGDVDFFEYRATGSGVYYVVFSPFDLELGLELEIIGADCAGNCGPISGAPGDNALGLLDGDLLRVRSGTDRAGPSASSGYAVEVTTTVPASSVPTR